MVNFFRDADRLRWAVFILFLVLCFLGGGGSRPDIQSLLYLRPLAILCVAALLIIPGRIDCRSVQTPLLMLAAFALIMATQLIPLPAGIWMQLPGHERFAEAAEAAGIAQPWRPLSISPDLTLNSIAALAVPLVGFVAAATISGQRFYKLLPVLIGASLLSALLAIIQLAQGPESSFYLYRITNAGAGVGFFANRNHQAIFMALTFPMLALWAAVGPRPKNKLFRLWIAFIISLLLIATILVSGSRAGLALGAAGLAFAYFQLRGLGLAPFVSVGGVWYKPLRWAFWIAGISLVAAAALLSRAAALERIISTNLGEARARDLPLLIDIGSDFYPLGSGIGTFDPLFRIYERHSDLEPEYLNHAHNDLLELWITGGLPALLLLGGFILWWARSSWNAFRPSDSFSLRRGFGRLGAIFILLLLLGSLVDYPVRTPILALLMALSCAWLSLSVHDPSERKWRICK